MPHELRALTLRTIAATLVALAVLFVLISLPGKTATAFGPIGTTICADENGRGHAPSCDVLIAPSWSPAVYATLTTHASQPFGARSEHPPPDTRRSQVVTPVLDGGGIQADEPVRAPGLRELCADTIHPHV